MIVARLRNGRVWEWELADVLSVNGQAVSMRDIQALELEDVRVGGRDVTVGGQAWRDLVQTDRATGIHVVTSMPLALAREVGGNLAAAGSIVVATEIPRSRG